MCVSVHVKVPPTTVYAGSAISVVYCASSFLEIRPVQNHRVINNQCSLTCAHRPLRSTVCMCVCVLVGLYVCVCACESALCVHVCVCECGCLRACR